MLLTPTGFALWSLDIYQIVGQCALELRKQRENLLFI